MDIMNNTEAEIFFLACEEKDLMSLLPVWQDVSSARPTAKLCTFGFSSEYAIGTLEHLISAKFPIVVGASPSSVDRIMRSIRPRWSFWLIGVEHGISPFKGFTYSSAFLVYDDYFAPNKLWLDRLKKLYPHCRTRFHLGDYAKANDFGETYPRPIVANTNTSDLNNHNNIVVILSWGIKEDVFFTLPDQVNITYLLHPAQSNFSNGIPFRNARVLWSKVDTAKILIESADIVFGDLSSLTFEVSGLRPTYLFLSNKLYVDNYDIDSAILDPNSPLYGSVPEADYAIDKRFILTFDELLDALHAGTASGKEPLSLEPMLMPQLRDAEQTTSADGILKLAAICDDIHGKRGNGSFDSQLAGFIRSAYRTILGREPDATGLRDYLVSAKSSDNSSLVIGLEILLAMARSKEAAQRPETMGDVWPILEHDLYGLPYKENEEPPAEAHSSEIDRTYGIPSVAKIISFQIVQWMKKITSKLIHLIQR